ncbi:O-acetylhomoserine aminocarboxypropyltransferase/cysteine synthase [Treponema phagedenis]|uniref:Cys/Met metabolism PLP-dependent enzyme (Modular protein) n=1 Tax=Treponema phagedenis TaxID=162 RepID=A0A0B7GZS7_TREPH|nr:O-acetylhomoserine aminocarboxypropyltransferase/cysteine synthase family protein [Treponema phagedenis]QEJ97517.1 O-acetylhomoserine aminocarboxypropyltransferase/cysteine synthase [Treponema phagedenis]QEK03084.1 O-acetylhomoserine aminocarboxypropyltransferase/cysteine synthase [Treponema phagedenis]QEK08710.1 O-acetylhomoserine aminocarboxypropyltransferase/cysteine synthase [Treponema phagedenis]QSH95871.1 O-acetylhomoserine aminocarboxypropyltransferase/cysteine synthase [Treponema pha
MSITQKLKTETLCVQGGYAPKNGEPRIVPIFQSTTFKYDTADEVAALFDLSKDGHMYSRISNPTLTALEEKIALLEGGVAALTTSSGQAATLLSILTICNCGEHVVAMNNLYGGTYTLLSSTIKKFGIEASFVPLNDFDAVKKAIKPNTKLVFAETIGNPGVEVADIEKLAKIAHEHDIPLFIDNTFATPCLCKPIEFGADIITHSSTKYLDGHATSVGGIIVDSGKFPWNNGKFSCLTDPDPNYHGLSYTEQFGNSAFIVKARVVFLRDLGATMSPFNAFLTNLGTETLALRMEKHSSNALKIAEFLEAHPKIEWVHYPLLKSNPEYQLAQKYLPNGASGVISFGVRGGLEETKKWINRLELASLVVHVGDLRTHVLHPASMTHRQLSDEAQKAAGILPNMVRLSVGIESADDIIKDLDQAFSVVGRS